jgi:hypothetical protein
MKTVKIERPSFLDKCVKDIHWVYGGTDIREASEWILKASQQLSVSTDGGPTALSSFIKASRLLNGVQVMVDSRVSRDLEITNVIGDLSKLIWPGDTLEMRFMDPALPTVLIVNQLNETGQRHGMAFLVDAVDNASMTLSINPKDWQSLIEGQYKENMVPRTKEDMPLDDQETEAIRYMALLAIKVLAYSSIPQHKPALLTTKTERKEAGFHPKRIMPKDKTFVVKYLPRVIRDREEFPISEPTGKTHRFLGRAGVLRFYENERYINVRGTWQFLPPIPPPDGVEVIVKIRKV